MQPKQFFERPTFHNMDHLVGVVAGLELLGVALFPHEASVWINIFNVLYTFELGQQFFIKSAKKGSFFIRRFLLI